MLKRWGGDATTSNRLRTRTGAEAKEKEMRLEIPALRLVSALERGASEPSCTTLVNHQGTGNATGRSRGGTPSAPPARRLRSRLAYAIRALWLALAVAGSAALIGCGSGLTGPAGSPLALPAAAQCTSDGLASQDLAGQCRTVPTTMGALEATG